MRGRSSAALTRSLEIVRSAQSSTGPPVAAVLDRAIATIVAATADSYSQLSATYAAVRGVQSTEWEEALTRALLSAVRHQIADRSAPAPAGARWRLLDVGAGSGRDLLRFAHESDIEPIALDNAPGLIHRLRDLAACHGLPPESVVEGEMRDLSQFECATFHCVRNHASLHHLPVVSPGHGADVAVAESRRILVAGGIFYVLVRAGEGLTVIDTREGLGARVFQLFSEELLLELLARHRFRALQLNRLVSERGDERLRWIFCLAIAI